MRVYLFACTLMFLVFGCGPAGKKAAPAKDRVHEVKGTVEKDTTQMLAPVFTLEKFQRLADSVITWHKIKVVTDSIVTDSMVLTRFEFMLGRQLYSMYEVYDFKKVEYAQDFYNDLKTREFISPFGINKRPHHILINNNWVIWHHLEHGYGHRVKEFNNVFNFLMPFEKKGPNLDSISGFTYCKCREQEYDMRKLSGKWKSVKVITAYKDTAMYYPYRDSLYIDNIMQIDLRFYKDSVTINNKTFYTSEATYIDLPDSKFYFKYAYLQDTPFYAGTTQGFLAEIKKLQDLRAAVTEVNIGFKNRQGISLVRLDDKRTFLYLNYHWYELKKV